MRSLLTLFAALTLTTYTYAPQAPDQSTSPFRTLDDRFAPPHFSSVTEWQKRAAYLREHVLESAGLFGRLRDARRQDTSPAVLADELVELALAAGTRDNSTVVVVRCLCPARKESIWKKDILAWMKRKPA